MSDQVVLEIFEPHKFDWCMELDLPKYRKAAEMDISDTSLDELERICKIQDTMGHTYCVKRRSNATS